MIDTCGAPIPIALDLGLALGNELGEEGAHHSQMKKVRASVSAAAPC